MPVTETRKYNILIKRQELLESGYCFVHREQKLEDGKKTCYKCTYATFLSKIKRKFGLTEKDYFNLLEQQNYCCKLCSITCLVPTNKKLPKKEIFNLDHDHNTGEFRGLICSACNRFLGRFGDGLDLNELNKLFIVVNKLELYFNRKLHIMDKNFKVNYSNNCEIHLNKNSATFSKICSTGDFYKQWSRFEYDWKWPRFEYIKEAEKLDWKCYLCSDSCRKKFEDKNRKEFYKTLCVDHSGNIIRGLLCGRCNISLGYFDDNLHRIQLFSNNLIKYLKFLP